MDPEKNRAGEGPRDPEELVGRDMIYVLIMEEMVDSVVRAIRTVFRQTPKSVVQEAARKAAMEVGKTHGNLEKLMSDTETIYDEMLDATSRLLNGREPEVYLQAPKLEKLSMQKAAAEAEADTVDLSIAPKTEEATSAASLPDIDEDIDVEHTYEFLRDRLEQNPIGTAEYTEDPHQRWMLDHVELCNVTPALPAKVDWSAVPPLELVISRVMENGVAEPLEVSMSLNEAHNAEFFASMTPAERRECLVVACRLRHKALREALEKELTHPTQRGDLLKMQRQCTEFEEGYAYLRSHEEVLK